MAYAGDRLYNEVIRKMMGDLATKVRVREIIAHLPCLTLSDREEIEAKRETCGNFNAIMLMLENLQRRENWPNQFISALRTCEQRALADEIHEAYDRIRGIRTPVPPGAATSVSPAAAPSPAPTAAAAPSPAPSPAEASAKVTTASIHDVPHSIPPLLTPSVEDSAQSATPPINSPPGPNSNIAAPASTGGLASVSASGAPVHPPPESAHPAEPPLSVLSPDARPPSPVSAPTLTPTIGQSEVPVSSRETSTLGISDASAPINSSPESCSKIASPGLTEAPALVSALEASVQPPREPAHPIEPPLLVFAPNVMPPSPVSAPKVTPSVGQSEIPVSSREPLTLGISGGLTNTALSGPSSVAAPTLPTNSISTSSQVNKPTTTSRSSDSPEKSKVPLTVVESTSSVKHPIQDTHPPGIVLAQDSQDNAAINQVVEKVNTAVSPNCQTQETAHASASASTDAVDGITAENEEYYSKPGVLREPEPFSISSDPLQFSHMTREGSPNHPDTPQADSNPHRTEEPVVDSVSVSTDNLMISSSTTAVQSLHVSDLIDPVQNSTPSAMENGLPEGDSNSYPHQPVEDHYESFHQRLQTEPETRIHIVEVSEGKSVQNLSGQPPGMAGPTAIGLSHNGETESLVQSVSEDQCSQGILQYMEGNNSREQASPAAGLTTCVEPAPSTRQGSELNTSGQLKIPQSEQREESQGVPCQFTSNMHLIAAAAIATAFFVALRLRH